MAALAGALAAATEAGRYAGGGVRTVGQRVGRSRFGRGARQAAAESQRRAFLAYQALRGMEFPVQPPPRRRPVVYVVGTAPAGGPVAGAGGRRGDRSDGIAEGLTAISLAQDEARRPRSGILFVEAETRPPDE